MSGNEIREEYLAFMREHKHAIIPSASLVPDNDPTTLFTGSGMQPLVPYLMGDPHPKGTRLADSQKCFRAEDIEEVGDNRHTTFFEMLGNWSLGDYFKEEQLDWFYTFLIETVELDPERIYVTVFAGDDAAGIGRDEESVTIWQQLFTRQGVSSEVAHMGSEESGGARGMQNGERIFYYDASKNWWSRAGGPENMPNGEIGGPDSEVFYDFGTEHDSRFGEHCHPNCDCGRFMEIGNSVFMEYIKRDGVFERLPKQNVDFGGGLERIAAASLHSTEGVDDVFQTSLLKPLVTKIESLSGKQYADELLAFRVIADHIRGAVFMIADGVYPSNTEQGYFVRRLLRRSVRYADTLNIPAGELAALVDTVVSTYKDHYSELESKTGEIRNTIADEEERFRKTLQKGMQEFEKRATAGEITGSDAFELFTTYGFPVELTEEIATEQNITVDTAGFERHMREHRERSRKGAEQKFKGGLADHSEKVLQYHTATHLMLAGLRKVLGEEVHQAGSNITAERTRFDFTYPEKVTREQLDEVEQFVNAAIAAKAPVTIEQVPKEEAQADQSIEGSFWERYPDTVNVYTIKGSDGTIYSRELCGGPHVENTGTIEGVFKITKEESVAAGIRRVKATLE